VTPSPVRTWRVLAAEAVADATRRRIVPVIAVLALVSLFFVDSCTSCSVNLNQNGEPVDLGRVAGLGGVVIAVLLGLWTMVLAGVLASDHLAEPLADGSADLALARPVSRCAFALARLAGALALAGAAGAVLLGGAGLLLQARQGLPLQAIGGAYLACLAGTVTVAALAMTASLALPRTLTALLVFGLVWAIGIVNAAAQLGAKLEGAAGLVERLGPPLASAMVLALASWIEPSAPSGAPLDLVVRSLLWAAGPCRAQWLPSGSMKV
jgi:ABC-type transport system involved in multi-copper enzyme maturation permease subunit